MSEQYTPDAPPPEEIPPIPQVVEPSTDTPLIATTAETPARTAPRWIAPAWFFFGIIVGIVGFAAYSAVVVKPTASTTTAQAESVDVNADMKNAAREGVLEAIATLQASNGQQQPSAQEQQGPQEVASNAFTVRDANRQGSADAKVTIYEFSDFQ